MKVLITGFEPFGGEAVNPSEEVVKALPDSIGNREIVKQILPTVFEKGSKTLIAALEKHQPDLLLCVGQAGGRSGITPERVAINLRDASIPDNEGNKPSDEPIIPQGEAAYFSTLPIKEMVQAVKDLALPATVSNTAGTFVCNEVMYTALHYAKTCCPHLKAGFVHIPYTESQVLNKPASTPFFKEEDILRAMIAMILVL